MTINLGGIVSGTGISSGLDSATLIEDLANVRRLPITVIDDKIEVNDTKISAFSNLKSILSSLRSSVDPLRGASTIINPFANVFDYRTPSLSSATLTPTSYLSVLASPGAINGITDIEIGNIAKSFEQSTGSFNSRGTDATTTATGSYFAAGTFEVGSGVVAAVTGGTSDSFQLSASDYTVDGSATGILTAAGINNIVVTGGNGGQVGLQGDVVGFTGSYDSDTGELTLTTVINGVEYTSNAITADTSINAGANTGIDFTTDGVITFTADSGGDNDTSFDIELNQDIIIDADTDNVLTFLNGIDSALSDQTIYQSREISNFVDGNVKSPLVGLTSSEIRYYSDSFDTDTGEFGNIQGFSAEFSTGTDGNLSVVIDGETYLATGLSDSLTTAITLNSTSSDKSITIDLANADGGNGITVDFSTETAAAEFERALDYAFGTRTLTDIEIEAGDSLNNIVFKINQQSATTGLSAAIRQIDDFDFRISLKSNNEGTGNAYEIFDDSNIFANASLATNQEAEDAILRVDGVEITRDTNTIDDIIEDVTLTLKQVTPDYNEVTPDTIALTIEEDIESVLTTVVGFIDAYNALKVYDAEQNARDENLAFTEDSTLGGDSVLRTLMDSIVNEISSAITGASDPDFDSLTDVGLIIQDFAGTDDTIATNNILTFDEDSLRAALTANYASVREIFEFSASFSSTNIQIFKTSNNFSLTDFQLDIDLDATAGEEVQLLDSNGDAVLDSSGENVYLTYSAGKITGPEGSVVEGLEFVYIGTDAEIIEVSIQQGAADRLYNIANAYVENDGVIDTAVDSLTQQNDDYEDDKLNLEFRLESFLERLQFQFSALEAAIQSVNNIILFLDTEQAVRTSNN